MPDVDSFMRSYLFVDVHRPATSDTVAALLEAAAAALRGHGEINVQHIAFEVAQEAYSAMTSMTIYYDRVERRQRDRPDEPSAHQIRTISRDLRPVD